MTAKKSASILGRQGSLRLCLFAVVALAVMDKDDAHARDIALGEYLSAECLTCHQLSGHSTGGIPPIVGLSEHHFVEALTAYKNGERHNEVMRNIAASLTLEEMLAIAAYFATHEPK